MTLSTKGETDMSPQDKINDLAKSLCPLSVTCFCGAFFFITRDFVAFGYAKNLYRSFKASLRPPTGRLINLLFNMLPVNTMKDVIH